MYLFQSLITLYYKIKWLFFPFSRSSLGFRSIFWLRVRLMFVRQGICFGLSWTSTLSHIQLNINGSNTCGTTKICSRRVLRANEGLLKSQVRWHNRDILLIYFNMKVYCVFSLESPQWGDSNEYSQYTIEAILISTHNIPFLNIKKKIIPNYPKSATMGFVPKFETSVVNKPSVYEPLKFYCIVPAMVEFWE